MRKTTGRLLLLFTLFSISIAEDTITKSKSIKDGQTLVSAGGNFVLGFFSPDSSSNRYLGIWFSVSNVTVVWVANRDKPLSDSSGVVQLDSTGNLAITDKANEPIWSSHLSQAGNTVAQLLDSGNFVLRNGNSGNTGGFLWQSFDYPTDNMLAGVKVGPDFRDGRDRHLTAWRNASDPAPADFTYGLDPRGLPQPFVWDKNTAVYRSGPWNGVRFSGTPEMASYTDMFNFTVVANQGEAYYEFGVTKPGILARVMLNPSGVVQRLVWDGAAWKPFWSAPRDQCDNYGCCGPYGVCDINRAPVCDCLHGFQPKHASQWYLRNWNGGCARKTRLNCSSGDGFLLVPQVKLPDTVNSTVNMSMELSECRDMCLKNCSCTAYAGANIGGGGSGCVIWTGDLVDLRTFTADGQDLYLRLATSELVSIAGKSGNTKKLAILIAVPSVLLLLVICGCCVWRMGKKGVTPPGDGGNQDWCLSQEDPKLPSYDFATIAIATNNFSWKNVIGKGGFGIVYKGNLGDREVAVKRMSLHAVQGIEEFKTELMLIANLQHINLVRLLGSCIKGRELILIYEYMPNKSLDEFIFDKQRRVLLDWRKRLDIILGIARGLLYLHQDSRLRIIHRDLKAGNILLDRDMNPKISDFGTARIFQRDQIYDNTDRIVGTIGYMSPEYAMDGVYSEKSDVFSFGVLVLEIISGRKNRWISQKHSELNLLSHAWRLWIEDRCFELKDDTLRCPCPFSQVLKCIQIGLLSVQESPDERPTMQQVLLALGSENPTLPQPKEPGFLKPSNYRVAISSFTRQKSSSMANITVTDLEGR